MIINLNYIEGRKSAGFTDGLRADAGVLEKKLMDLQKYVGQLEGQLHKEGNWRTTKFRTAPQHDHHDREILASGVTQCRYRRCTLAIQQASVTFTDLYPFQLHPSRQHPPILNIFHTNHSARGLASRGGGAVISIAHT